MNDRLFYEIFASIARLGYVVLSIFGLLNIRKMSGAYRFLIYLVFLATITDGTVLLLRLKDITSPFLYHFYTIFEYSLLSIVLSFWQRKPAITKAMRASILPFAMIWIISKISGLETFSHFDAYTASLSCALLTLMSMFTLVNLINDYFENITRRPEFWITLGILIYTAGNAINFAVSKTIFYITWNINNFLTIAAILCYAGGLLLQIRSNRYGPSSWQRSS
ncbi:MAG: hypothetical protein V2J62_01220 [candidate division KSB1 bacterium]|jgi:hypothetical protein|nr:hypothetical protein [candidate division KSB1 bacterium]